MTKYNMKHEKRCTGRELIFLVNMNKVKHVLFVTGMPKKRKSELRAKKKQHAKEKSNTNKHEKLIFKKVERGLELRA